MGDVEDVLHQFTIDLSHRSTECQCRGPVDCMLHQNCNLAKVCSMLCKEQLTPSGHTASAAFCLTSCATTFTSVKILPALVAAVFGVVRQCGDG